VGVVYVLENEAYLSKEGGTLKVSRRAGREVLLQKPLIAVEEIVILGNAVVTPALLKHCAQEGVGIHYLSRTGTYYAGLTRTPSKNAPARVAQFKAHLEPTWKLALAQRFVLGKIRNGLVFLRRNGAEGWEGLKEALLEAERAQDEEALRGAEGRAADLYFRAFAELLPEEFAFGERSRRPPRDPANSLLSLAYTLLAKQCESALLVAGLDPYCGLPPRGALRPPLVGVGPDGRVPERPCGLGGSKPPQ